MDSLAYAADDNVIRRVRSTGDVPSDNETLSPRPARVRRSHRDRRSEGSGSTSHPNSVATRTTFGSIGSSSLRSGTTPSGTTPSPVEPRQPATQWDGMPRVQVEQRPAATTPPRRPAERTGWVGVVMTFLGYEGPGARARREMLSMSFALFSYFAQVSKLRTITL